MRRPDGPLGSLDLFKSSDDEDKQPGVLPEWKSIITNFIFGQKNINFPIMQIWAKGL